MPVGPPSAEYMAEVVASMRETIRARSATAPDPVNADAALSLFEGVPLLWGGTTHRVGKISYRDGLLLDQRRLRFRAFQTAEQTESELTAHLALLDAVLAQMWGLLDPKPAENPFLDAAPLEVGALMGFFLTCLQIQNQRSRAAAISRSPTTTSTPSLSS